MPNQPCQQCNGRRIERLQVYQGDVVIADGVVRPCGACGGTGIADGPLECCACGEWRDEALFRLGDGRKLHRTCPGEPDDERLRIIVA